MSGTVRFDSPPRQQQPQYDTQNPLFVFGQAAHSQKLPYTLQVHNVELGTSGMDLTQRWGFAPLGAATRRLGLADKLRLRITAASEQRPTIHVIPT